MISMTRAMILILAALFSTPPVVFADPTPLPLLLKQLRGHDMEKAAKALDALRAGDDAARSAAKKTVDVLQKKRTLALKTSAAKLQRCCPFLGDERRRTALEKAFSQWREAAEEVISFAFDNTQYPFPPKARTGWVPGKDYQKGQVLLEGRVEVCLVRYNQAESALLGCFGRAARPGPPGGLNVGKKYLAGSLRDNGKAVPVAEYNLTDTTPMWKFVARNLGDGYRTYSEAKKLLPATAAMAEKLGMETETGAAPAEIPGLIVAAAAIFSGDYAAAAEYRPPAESLEGMIFRQLVRKHIMIRNEAAQKGWSRAELMTMRTLNLYRIALNLWPLRANDKIQAAAREHSAWQARHRTMSHTRPAAEFKTFANRCKRQGYPAPGGENISMSTGAAAVWHWRADAGHHRNLINRSWRAMGLGAAGRYTTYNAGRVIEDEGLMALVK